VSASANASGLERAAHALEGARRAVAVTGAGISAESGIPTFRGAEGIWVKYPPGEYATIEAFHANPRKVWRFWRQLAADVRACAPNPAHHALADLERRGRLKAIITQNIDNLHQAAGSRVVVEYHGNTQWLMCPSCNDRRPLDLERAGPEPPRCPCGSVMKTGVVMSGEAIPPQAMADADQLAGTCDVMLVVGTSAQVFPAALLPVTAKRHGALVIECNIEPTEFTRRLVDIFLEGPAGALLPALAARVATPADAEGYSAGSG